MAFLFNCVVAWMVMMILLKVEAIKVKADFTNNSKSVFCLEERNVLALDRIYETLQKLAEPQAKCDKEVKPIAINEVNEKLLSLIAAVENTQNTVKIIAEANKKPVTDLCGSPYVLVGKECFHISSHEKDWDSAKLQCQREGGSLAAPEDLDLLRQHLRYSGEVADYWIGGHDTDGIWKWITGDSIEGVWQSNQPSGRPGEDCLKFSAGRWPSLNDYECHETQKYICERSYTGTVPPTLEPVDCSSEDAIQVGQKCLTISVKNLNWHDAANACTSNGGQLVSLQDKSDIQMVHEYLDTNHRGNKFWLGASDFKNEGHWVWMDNQPLKKFPWRCPEPNGGERENCLNWGHAYHFNDAPCRMRWRYICELGTNGGENTTTSTVSTDNTDVSSIVGQSTGTDPETTLQDSNTETTLDDDSSFTETRTSETGTTSETSTILQESET